MLQSSLQIQRSAFEFKQTRMVPGRRDRQTIPLPDAPASPEGEGGE